jgi:hypothetical protein
MFDTEIKPNQPAIECVYQDNYGDEPHIATRVDPDL